MNDDKQIVTSSLTASTRVSSGFEVFRVQNAELEMAVVPALGARVISLRNRRKGREWMWHPGTALELFRNEPGDDFSKSPLVGWDECLPTIAPCQWKGCDLPDHGKVWSAAWDIDAQAWTKGVIITSVRLSTSPLYFQRRLEIEDNKLLVHYRLLNLSGSQQEYLWAMHPLLALQPGDELELSEEIRAHLLNERWLDTLEFGDVSPACAKVFAGPLREGRAGVRNSRSGERLTFTWNVAEADTLGIWLNRGGADGYHHIALEPCNGANDSLAVTAGKRGRSGVLAPHAEKEWSVQIEIQS